jgi:hypothetical protein
MNKRLFCAVAALFQMSLPVVAQGTSDYAYVDIESFTGETTVEVRSVEDFRRMAEDLSVTRLFRYAEDGAQYRAITTVFFFSSDGVLYLFDGANYHNLSDFDEGSSRGFVDGRDYYHAQELGVASADEYELLTGEWFLSLEDLRDARDRGFLSDETRLSSVIYPEALSATAMAEEFLPMYVRWRIEHESELGTAAPLEELQAAKIVRGVPSAYGRQSITIPQDLPPSSLYAAVDILRSGFIQESSQGRRPGRASGNPDEALANTTSRVFATGRLPYARGTGPLYELVGDAPKPEWRSVPAGVAYYFATWTGFQEYERYAETVRATEQGYESVEDARAAHAGGFTSSANYYRAKQAGFTQLDDYQNAQRMNLRSFDEYARYRVLLDELDEIREEYQLNSDRNALVIRALRDVGRGRTVSFARIAQSVNETAREYSALSRLQRGFGAIEESRLGGWFEAYGERLRELGHANLDDLVFTGR